MSLSISTIQKKIYGFVVKEQRKNLGWTQEQLAKLIGVTTRSLQYIESGEHHPGTDIKFLISSSLKLRSLVSFPPDISTFSELIKERFLYEQEAITIFLEDENKELVKSEVHKIFNLYNSANNRQDSMCRSLADRLFHARIIYAYPEDKKRNRIFQLQSDYIDFFQNWVPYLPLSYSYFENRKKNIKNHKKLFYYCLKQELKPAKNTLEDHMQISFKDIEIIQRYLD